MAGETVLVVDDDPFMRELLAEALSEAGYDVISAADGKQALQRLSLNEFEVALIDLSLPDVDGMELVSSTADGSPETQIIIMTGYPSLDSAIEALRQGAQDYLIKPFKIPEVHAAVGRAVKNQKLQVEVRGLRLRVRDLQREVDQLRAGGGTAARPQPSTRPMALPGSYGAPAVPRISTEPEEEGPRIEPE